MIIWINGAFGSGKTTTAYELHRRLPNSFVYDPENVGYFIRKNTNALFSKGDFQDIPLWREMNYKMLYMIAKKYVGTIIVPMTLVNPDYYNEIVARLRSDGIDVKHYILYATHNEIERRIKKRAFMKNDNFALGAIARCVCAFDKYITDIKIFVDDMSLDSVVDKIGELAQLQLVPDKRAKLGKSLHRIKVMIKHIR